MKTVIFTAIGLFWICVAGLLLLSQAPEDADAPTDQTERSWSAVELAAHNHEQDCWLAINGSIYDVTKYIDRHPAPRSTITDSCGKDATKAFETKGRNRPHSTGAWLLLEHFRVGRSAD